MADETTQSVTGETEQRRPVSSVGELLRAALSETEALETGWSAALDSDGQSRAIRDHKQRLAQSFKRIEAWADAIGGRLSERGLDRLTTNFPLQPEDAASLSAHPTGDQVIRQLWLALFYTLREASIAFAAVGTENERRPNAHTGERLGSFWEAGSFSLLRQRILSLSDVIDRFALALGDQAAELGLLAEQIGPPLVDQPAQNSFERAQALVRLGYHDAALPLLLEALYERVRSTSEEDSGSEGIGITLDPSLHRLLTLLVTASARLGQGARVRPEVAVPLAELFVDLLPGLHVVGPESDAGAEAAAAPDTDADNGGPGSADTGSQET